MRSPIQLGVVLLVSLGCLPAIGAEVDFAKEIYPVLKENCFKCHGADRQKGKMRLDIRAGVSRAIRDDLIVPGNPDKSELFQRISLPKEDDDVMPPEDEGGPLPDKQVALVRQWIAEGARWVQPEGVPVPESTPEQSPDDEIDFRQDIEPILAELTDQQRELIIRWAREGGPIPPELMTPSRRSRESMRLANGLQVFYDFRAAEGEVIQDRVGNLDLRVAEMDEVRRSEGTLDIRGDTQLRSAEAAASLIEAVQLSRELTLEAWIRPANTEQEGPARILTLSQDSGARNFTLGQDGGRYDVRLRTTSTSDNGLPSVSTPDNRVSTDLTHVVYTRDRSGRARIYLNGQINQDQQVMGEVSNWDGSYRLALGNEFNADRLWKGTYHMIAIYNRDLLPGEVRQNFKAGPDAEMGATTTGQQVAGAELFHSEIAPMFVERCMECHDPANQKGDLDLSKRVTAFKGGESGAVIEPGNAEDSLLWKLVKDDEMPKERDPLPTKEKEALKRWLNEGASWPVEEIDALAYSRGESAGQNRLRRLTVSEYIETVRASLEVNIADKARELLPKDVRADGFRNTAYNLNVDLQHVEAYRELAEIIVGRMDVGEFASKYVDCERLTDDCMRELVAKMGKWILRGPLSDHEVTVFRGIASSVAAAGGDFEEAVRYTIQAMVQAPGFLYRIEHQKGDGTRWPVSGYELASRMSYIIWGGPPDEELMQAADEGTLYDRSAVEAQVERMLKDPRAMNRSLEFVSQWLNLDRLDNLNPNPEKFPNWNDKLAEDMRRETLMFFRDIVWGQKRPLADLMNAQLSYMTPRLAKHYGIEPQGEGRSRYNLKSVPTRGGLLTHGSVLTIGGDEASTVTRGLFVLRDILRGRVGEPPPCLDTSPVPTEPGLTKRAIANNRIANPSCGGCHGKFEPLSFGLVQYDGLGSFMATDEHGNDLRDDGELVFPDEAEPVPYDSSAEMMDLLAQSERVEETFTWKLTQFAIGRPLGPSDVPIVESIHESAQEDGGTYSSLITAIIQSDLVQTIKTEKPHEQKQYTQR